MIEKNTTSFKERSFPTFTFLSNSKTFFIAEIGANHNGSIDQAIALIDSAKLAGADAVKFQKRNPHLSIPEQQKNEFRTTTEWGTLTYLEYRLKLEFGLEEYQKISRYCQNRKIIWFASAWDVDSVSFLQSLQSPILKIPSACLINKALLMAARNTGIPLYLSTGMSTMEEIECAVNCLGENNLLLAHTTSTYPCRPEELNLRMIPKLAQRFPSSIVGYSGHDLGFSGSLGAVALGARFLERHFTLDHNATGTDHRFSLNAEEFTFLVNEVRSLELALGNGEKRVYESEVPFIKKLRNLKFSKKLKPVSKTVTC